MKKLIMLAGIALLVGCSPSAKQRDFPVLPEELKGCKFFRLTDSDGSTINVARCPNSSTTVRMSDKPGTTSIVIDGMEYVPK